MKSNMIQVGSNFWNIRSSFPIFCGFIDIGAQMSIIRLSNLRYLIFDTCTINPLDKAVIDRMTEGGSLIEGIVATHPFHTSSWSTWYHWYPSTRYYGTPRHIRLFPEIPWLGDVSDPITQQLWEEEGIFLKIPNGSDFDPVDESNHFSSLFVFHEPSRTLHVNDTICMEENPNIFMKCCGIYPGKMRFWPIKKGLHRRPEARKEFQYFMETILKEWDFDNIVVAHRGRKLQGAKEELRKTLKSYAVELN